MKKKYIKIVVYVLILAVLAAAYFIISDSNENDTLDDFDADIRQPESIVGSELENVDYIVLTSENGVTEIIRDESNEEKWVLKGFEGVKLNQNNIESIVKSTSSLEGERLAAENADLKEYGLDNPNASAYIKFKDGSDKTVYRGDLTPDKAYYYVSSDGDGKVYMISELHGGRFSYGINDFIDKTVPQVSPYKVTYLDIKQKNKPEIELEYVQEKEGNAENLIMMGMETIRMNKPYDGAVVYPSNLQESVLYGLNDIALGDVAEAVPKDLAAYGLLEPAAEIEVGDGTNTIKITVGNDYDDSNVYCMLGDKPHVFLMEKRHIEPFLNADVLKFMERFVGLHYRADVKSVDMRFDDMIYEIAFDEGESSLEEENDKETQRFNDDRKTYLNGKEIDKENFSHLFELLAGIAFDSIDPDAKADGEAEVGIKYVLNDGSVDEILFYPYNDNFYVAERGELKGQIVSRQSVDRVFDKADELLNE